MEQQRWFKQLQNGAYAPGDNGTSIEKKPPWFDECKYRKSLQITKDYISGFMLSHLLGTIIMSQVSSLLDVLHFSKEQSTIRRAMQRAALTYKYVSEWYKGDVFDPEDDAHKSLKRVRQMHLKVANKMNTERPKDTLWMSQYDMALTQFAFIGALVCNPKKLGVHCSDELIQDSLYFWRCIGYLLGIEDQYNICGRSLRELRILSRDIVKEVVLPTHSNPREEYTKVLTYAFYGFKRIGILVRLDSMFNISCDVIGYTQFKKALNFQATFYYWITRFNIALLRFNAFRLHANKASSRKSQRAVDKILLDCKNASDSDLVLEKPWYSWIQVLFDFAKRIWSAFFKTF